jgi:RHS repeat-associated protein
MKTLNDVDGSNTINAGDYFSPDVVSFSDNYPFGMGMPGRKFAAESYRYGFQGQEKENDVVQGGFAFRYRIQDSRIGRFLSVDPLSKKYAWNSTYSFAMNRVIDGVELEGLEYLEVGESRVKIINGEVHINIENFHNSTKNAWKQRDRMGNYANKDQNIGQSTKVEDFDMPGVKSATPVHFGKQKPGGLAKHDPTSITTTNSKGKLHWHYKNVPVSGRNKKTPGGGGGVGVVNGVNWGMEQVQIWQQQDDRKLTEAHKSIIFKQVMQDINEAIKQNLVPPEYMNTRNMGDIANVVLTGVNLTTDDKIYEVGIEIVKVISKNYKPNYQQKNYSNNPSADNTNLGGGYKIMTEKELKDFGDYMDTEILKKFFPTGTTDANTIEGQGIELPK